MLKKSLLLSVAVLLTAVLFVFTGCESPTDGRDGLQGEPGKDNPFPDEVGITVNIPPGSTELPKGITFPDGRASIVAGTADDIIRAFAGGIRVADTSDATGGSIVTGPAATGTQWVYEQDAVDYVIWNGPPATAAALGTLSVPPGKTLFINAPLTLDGNGATNTFTGISISDPASYESVGDIPTSVLASLAGSPVAPGDSGGKLVILATARVIVDGSATIAPTFTNGGILEIHRGAAVDLTGGTADPALISTPGSKTEVYGSLTAGTAALSLYGALNVRSGGSVNFTAATTPVFGEDVTVAAGALNPAAIFVLPTAGATFEGNLTVGEGVPVSMTAGNVTFNKTATIDGTFNATAVGLVNIGSNGWLEITEKGTITGDWTDIRTGGAASTPATAKNLRAAFGAEAPSTASSRVTIADPNLADGLFMALTVTCDDYEDLVWFAESTKLHLVKILYESDTDDETQTLVIAKDNTVDLGSTFVTVDAIGNVTVQDGGTLILSDAVDTAGNIIVVGELEAATATFGTALTKLTIGDGVTKTDVDLPAATFAAYSPPAVIELKDGASLEVGGTGTGDITFAGEIILGENSKFITATTNTGTNFANLTKLTIEEGALFDASSLTNYVVFTQLTQLKVHGTIYVPSNAIAFTNLNADVGTMSGNTYDVYGDGRAIFPGFNITSAVDHAFDQLLGIQDLTVGTLDATVPAATGFNATIDAKASPSGAVLRTSGITVPAQGSFLVDRNLDLLNTGAIVLTNGTLGSSITIDAGITVYSGGKVDPVSFEDILSPGKPALGGSDTEQTASATISGPNGGASTNALLTATDGVPGNLKLTVRNLTLKAGDTLQVPGTLSSDSSITIGAGAISLIEASLTKGSLADTAGAGTVTVFDGGTLSSTGLSLVPSGSDIVVKEGGKITGIGSGRITFATTGPYIGEGILTALEDGAIEATSANEADLSGSFNGTGATVLNVTGGNTKKLNLTGTVILGSLTGYNGAKIGGGTVISSGASNTTVLNGATGTVILGAGHEIKDGSLTTRGTGGLVLAAGTTLTAAVNDLINSTSSQSLEGVTFTPGGFTGDLTLASNAVLTIGTAFSVNPQTAATSTLDVSSGAIKLLDTKVLTLVKENAGTYGAILTNGTWTLTSHATSSAVTDYLSPSSAATAGEEPLDEGLYDLIASFAATGGNKSTADKAALIAGSSGAVSITGKTAGTTTYNTINSSTRVLNSNNS
jgi:hypothetical protein